MTARIIRVVQLIDSLDIGGAERMAVNIANALPPDKIESYICVTRRLGPLQSEIAPHVKFIFLDRRNRIDIFAFCKFIRFLRSQKINIIHAHGSSVFIVAFAKFFVPRIKIIWHDHNGKHLVGSQSPYPFRLITFALSHVFVVNHAIYLWITQSVGFSSRKTQLIHNFVTDPPPIATDQLGDNFGTLHNRVVFVANLRHPKDHFTLVQAMALVIQTAQAHLLLVGGESDTRYATEIQEEVARQGLQPYIHFLGQRSDVYEILQSSTIGVISSKSEGLPLALLEYGMVGLPVISTRVGQCPEVLLDGKVGMLVNPSDSKDLAESLLELLGNAVLRRKLGEAYQKHVIRTYSKEANIEKIVRTYFSSLSKQSMFHN